MPYSWSDEDGKEMGTLRTFNRPAKSKPGVRRSQPPPRRVKQTPIPAKPCVVWCRKQAMGYAKTLKMLFFSDGQPSGLPFEFPSKRQARKAIWHTLQYYSANGVTKEDGTLYHADDFEYRFVNP